MKGPPTKEVEVESVSSPSWSGSSFQAVILKANTGEDKCRAKTSTWHDASSNTFFTFNMLM
jgi:hypothetical protein